jgi:hypothetical protein
MKNKEYKKGGISILSLLVLGIAIVLIFSYFKINVRTVLNSQEGQSNTNYVTKAVKDVWDGYLKKPTKYLWNNAVNLFWKTFLDSLSGKGTSFQNLAPVVPLSGFNNQGQNPENQPITPN